MILGLYPLEPNGGTLLQLLHAVRCHSLRLPESLVVAFLLRLVGATHWIGPVIPLVGPRCSVGCHFLTKSKAEIRNKDLGGVWLSFGNGEFVKP